MKCEWRFSQLVGEADQDILNYTLLPVSDFPVGGRSRVSGLGVPPRKRIVVDYGEGRTCTIWFMGEAAEFVVRRRWGWFGRKRWEKV